VIYINSLKKIRIRTIALGIVILILGLYLFGLAGNYRMQNDYSEKSSIEDSSLILNIGKANQKFQNSKIPDPLFWTYIYISSPISNLQLNENLVSIDSDDVNFKSMSEYIIVNFLPDVISNRVYSNLSIKYRPWLITPEFTASSAFIMPYLIMGWGGLYVFLLYLLFFPIVYLWIIKKIAVEYFDISLALVASMYLFMPFANFFAFSPLSLQLLLPIICSFIGRLKIISIKNEVKTNY